MRALHDTRWKLRMAKVARLILAGAALVAWSAPPARADLEGVWALAGGQKHPAENAPGNLWHVVTQGGWPDTISLEVEWRLPTKELGNRKTSYECSTASISSDDPSFTQEGAPVGVDSGLYGRRYLFTAAGVKTNRSIVKSEVYKARLMCYYRLANQKKVTQNFETTIRVDANATAFFDPGLTETQYCVEFLRPRDGGQVPLADGNKMSVKSIGWPYMTIQVERAAKIETGVHGDLSLPEGKAYVSEWTAVYQGDHGLPEAGKTLNLRLPSEGLTQGGLYRARVFCLGGQGFNIANTPWSPWIQYTVGEPKIVARRPLSEQAPGGLGSSAKAPAVQADPKGVKVTAPKLVVKSIAVHPAPLKAGTPVNLEIAFENKGAKASGPDAKYKLTCTVLHGGPECPAPSGDGAIGKGIEPGQTGSVILLGAKPAVAGEYRVSVAVPPDQMGRPYSITLSVAPVVTGPRTQPPDQRPQIRPGHPAAEPPPDDGKPGHRLVPTK